MTWDTSPVEGESSPRHPEQQRMTYQKPTGSTHETKFASANVQRQRSQLKGLSSRSLLVRGEPHGEGRVNVAFRSEMSSESVTGHLLFTRRETFEKIFDSPVSCDHLPVE